MWQIWLKVILVREEFKRRGIKINNECLICKREVEDLEYLFNYCERI